MNLHASLCALRKALFSEIDSLLALWIISVTFLWEFDTHNDKSKRGNLFLDVTDEVMTKDLYVPFRDLHFSDWHTICFSLPFA
jgi:hypothetical protein